MPRAAVEVPLLSRPERRDVALRVEDGEAVAVLQHVPPLLEERGRREDVEPILELDDVVHGRVSGSRNHA